MSATVPFEYAILQVVPRVDRGECMNAGVLLYCQAKRYLGSRVWLDVERLRALDTTADAGRIAEALQVMSQVCVAPGQAGPAGRESLGRRFRWLTAPRSTVVRSSPVHTGLTAEPDAEITRLLEVLVYPVTGD